MSKISKDFLWITFLFMIACWGICVVCSMNGYVMNEHYILYLPWILGGLSPTIASYIAQKKNGVVGSLKDWFKRVFNMKQSICFYAITIFLVVIYYILQCMMVGFKIGMPVYFIVILLPLMLIGGGLEEAGWRMILQPELEKKYSFVLSTLIVFVIWWVWHLPLFFIQGTGQFGSNFFYFGIGVLALSFASGAIRKVTNSVFLCVFAHCLNNALSSVFLFQGTLLSYSVASAVVVIISIVLVKKSSVMRKVKFH